MNNIKMNQSVKASTIRGFKSTGMKVGSVKNLFPKFTGTRIMMMPFYVQDIDGSLPESLSSYKTLLKKMVGSCPDHVRYWEGNTAYLTIDEKSLVAGQCQRKEGLHVDGMYKGMLAGAWGGQGGGWGSCGNGMLLVSNTDDLCKMWIGDFDNVPVNDGDCEHLRVQLETKEEVPFKNGDVIWADGLCVHQSFAPKEDVDRQFVRISMPNNSPWFEGYTVNPLGILPSGHIIKEKRV